MQGPTIRASRWCAWTRNRTSCWATPGNRSTRSPGAPARKTRSAPGRACVPSSCGSRPWPGSAGLLPGRGAPAWIGPKRSTCCPPSTTPMRLRSSWSWATPAPTPWVRCTRRSPRPRHGSWPPAWKSTTRPSTDRGSTSLQIELSALSRQCPPRRIPDLETLNHELGCWQETLNAEHRPVRWHFTIDGARTRLRHLYPEN